MDKLGINIQDISDMKNLFTPLLTTLNQMIVAIKIKDDDRYNSIVSIAQENLDAIESSKAFKGYIV